MVRDDVREAYLDLTVETAGPDPGWPSGPADEFDYLVEVRADYPRRRELTETSRVGRSLDELYALYYAGAGERRARRRADGDLPSVLEEAGYASP